MTVSLKSVSHLKNICNVREIMLASSKSLTVCVYKQVIQKTLRLAYTLKHSNCHIIIIYMLNQS